MDQSFVDLALLFCHLFKHMISFTVCFNPHHHRPDLKVALGVLELLNSSASGLTFEF